jgi:hypothetical protein
MASLFPDDPEHIIFIPTSPEISLTEQFPAIRSKLISSWPIQGCHSGKPAGC